MAMVFLLFLLLLFLLENAVTVWTCVYWLLLGILAITTLICLLAMFFHTWYISVVILLQTLVIFRK